MPVGSTVPVRIELPDDQYHPRVAGGVIVFESQSPSTLHSDLYVYEIASNRLFQFSNTPTLDETLNGITRLPTGELRVVWQVNDDTSTGIPSNNIYGATFALPSLRLCTLQDIIYTHVTTQCRQTITGVTLPFGSGTVAINLTSPAGASFTVPPTIAGGFPTGPGLIFPGGIISYTVELPAGVVGADATVAFTFTPPLPPNTTKLFKVIVDRLTGNSTLQQIDSARWTRIDNATSSVITLTLTDGVYPLDLDGMANGIIIDP
jgi:hypothetical protein